MYKRQVAAQSYYQQFLRQKTPVIRVGTMGPVYNYLTELIEVNQKKSMYSELVSSKLITGPVSYTHLPVIVYSPFSVIVNS